MAGQRARRQPPSITGEVYKMELDGTIVGKFGRAGKAPGEFCDDSPDGLPRSRTSSITAEINNWRSQKILLKPQAMNRRSWCNRGNMSHDAHGLRAAAVLAFRWISLPRRRSRTLFDGNADLLEDAARYVSSARSAASGKFEGPDLRLTRGRDIPYATVGRQPQRSIEACSRLFQFDQNGKFVRELGQDVYGFNAATGIRVDPQDNIWTIDIGASQVVKFDADGRVALALAANRKSSTSGPASPGPAGTVGSGVRSSAGTARRKRTGAAGGRGGPEGCGHQMARRRCSGARGRRTGRLRRASLALARRRRTRWSTSGGRWIRTPGPLFNRSDRRRLGQGFGKDYIADGLATRTGSRSSTRTETSSRVGL